MSVFSVHDLRVTFRQREREVAAVRGVSFGVDAGKTLAIVGESGSGKSVSLLAATGLLNAANAVVGGSGRYDGVDLVGLSPRRAREFRGKQIGFVFQDPQANLHPLKTIGHQVGEAITAHERVGRKALRARVIELLDEVGIKDPARRVDDHPVHFSGGMRQRAMIAMAIALRPGLLIADEATTALDVTVQASILKLLRRLQSDHGMALIFVSHDLAVVSDIADDVVVMKDGLVVEQAPADRIYERPEQPYTRELLGATRHGAGVVREPVAAATEQPVLVRVTGLRREFTVRGQRRRSFAAVDGVDFDIRRREILGLVGESGSGKSTIGRVLAGLVRPSAGAVSIDQTPYNVAGPGRPHLDPATRRRIQVVFQDPFASLNPRRSVRSLLAEPYLIQRDVPRSGLSETVEALVARVELPKQILDRFPSQLSGGQRQRVAIARALALQPDLVIADEAVSALDITTQSQILALLRRLRDELGVSFLFISHDLAVVADLCDRVVVLEAGQIVEQGPTAAVFAAPTHPYTRLLLDSIPGRARGLVEQVPADQVPTDPAPTERVVAGV